jgi:hypothetical protein
MATTFVTRVTDIRLEESATNLLARPGERLALSLVLAGMRLPCPRFAPDTRPNMPSGPFN